MKFIIRLLVVALIGVGAVCGVSAILPPASAASKQIDWNAAQVKWLSFDDGMREAARTGKPILTIFYAEWCPHCVAYSRLFHDPEVIGRARDLVMVRVNGDEEAELSARYSPDGGYIPRTLVIRPNGKLDASIHGAQDQYRYFLDHDSTSELLSVMKRAAASSGAR